ncbi:MAG: cupredoxin domain-containing protein [Chloroflexi bacterium]|nr:cupredoxin domain-containing protein [Chloroflexota bacterium]
MKRSKFLNVSARLTLTLLLAAIIIPQGTVSHVLAHGSDHVQIDIEDGFEPASVSIQPGTTVEWRNKEHQPHTVTGQSATFNSGVIPKSGKYRYTFNTSGIYTYTDQFSSFAGTIMVLGTSSPPPPAVTPPPVPTPNPNPNPNPVPPPPSVMRIGDNFFTPASFSTTVGTTVTWTNNGQKPHSVTSNIGVFDSGMLNPGQIFSFSFQSPGTYSYHCVFHSGQAGTITVTGTGNSPPPNQVVPTPTPTPTPTPAPVAGGNSIQIGDNLYSPAQRSLVAGATVTWTNVGQRPHTVTSTGLFDSGMLNPGQSFSFTFQSPGTYPYHCIFHDGQAGTITVTGTSNTPPPSGQTVPPAPNQTAVTPPEPMPVPPPASVPVANDIHIGDNVYHPVQLSLVTGATAVWTNSGRFPHTVTSDTGLFDSGMLKPGDNFSFSFQSPGTYAYHCIYHSGQAGTILVGDGNTPTSVLPPPEQPRSTQSITIGNTDNEKTLAGDPSEGVVVNDPGPMTDLTFAPKVFLGITALAFLMGSLALFGMLKKLG